MMTFYLKIDEANNETCTTNNYFIIYEIAEIISIKSS